MKTQVVEILEPLPPTKTNSGPQSLMLTIGGTVVREYDKLLNSYNEELIGLNTAKTVLREDRDELQRILNKGTKVLQKSDENSLEERGTKITLNNSQKEKLKQIFHKYGYTFPPAGSDGYFFPDETIEKFQEKIDGQIQDLNSTSEIKMINFQSLMDARKQAMLMLSNLLQADKTIKEAIIQNMRG